jgi:hypothetical protein
MKVTCRETHESRKITLTQKRATVNQHPPAHHPMDGHYYSVVDEAQLS